MAEEKEDIVIAEQPSRISSLLDGFISEQTSVELQEIEKGKAAPLKKEESKKEPADKKAKDEPKKEKEEIEPEEKQEEEEEEEENSDSEKKSQKGNGKKEEEKEEEIEISNKFGIKLNKKEDKKGATKLDIKTFDELPAVLKSKYGQEIKDPKGLSKFFESSVDKWRSDSQSLEKVTKEKDNAIAIFEQLPPELLDAVKMHYDGQDFRKAFEGSTKIDFSKPVGKHKPEILVNTFFPGEFTAEDFEADEPSKELKFAIKASEKEYNSEKTAREQRAKTHVEQAQRKNEAFKTSVKSSVTALKVAFPDMAADVLADTEHTLSSGAIMSDFFNPDGTYKQNAAEMFMLAKHGKELIEQLMEIAQRRGESSANEEMVRRSPDKPKDKRGGKETPIRKEVAAEIENFLPSGLVKKNTF